MTMRDRRTIFPAVRTAPRTVFEYTVTASPRTIGQAIQAAADAIEDDSLRRLSPDDAPPFPQARAVLALLAHCYALQIYSSREAASLAARDRSFPCLCQEELPDACVLRRFRAENREAIARCLATALRFLVEQKISSGVVTKAGVPHVAEEASRRIIMAMFVDSLELDGEPEEDLAA
jgi:hypothetical protein